MHGHTARAQPGFASALTLPHLAWALAGVTLGTAVGVLPGIGPALTVALLLPVTFTLEPTSAFIMFAGIYYGAMYGGSTTSILLNTPGRDGVDRHRHRRPHDGAPGTRRGGADDRGHRIVRGGHARHARAGVLRAAAGVVRAALRSGRVLRADGLAFTTVSVLLGSSIARGLFSLFLGLALGLVGIDQLTGEARLSFGIPQLLDGIDVVILVIGLFAVGETLFQAWRHGRDEMEVVTLHDFTGMSRDDWKRSWKPWLRGTAIGFPLGVLPCGGSVIPTFLSYMVEKRLSREPERVRARRHRRRGRSGGCQQRGGRRRAGAAAHARSSFVGHGGDHARRVSAVRPAAGSAAVRLASRSGLDADRQPVSSAT